MKQRWVGLVLAMVSMLAFACGGDDEETAAGDDTEQPDEPAAPAAVPVVAQVCAGIAHTCVMRATGEVFCAGSNLNGQLGDSTAQNRSRWVPVAGLSGATSISCGAHHTCAITGGGSVSCWGRNNHGELGGGNDAVAHAPVAVPGIADAVEIATGNEFTCARRAAGAVSCWGSGDSSRLGSGSTDDSHSPVSVAGLNGAAQITAGRAHVCARKDDGTVWCWGAGGSFQLGQGESRSNATSPVQVQGLTGATIVSAGGNHTCAATATQVFCWGANRDAQIGAAAAPTETNVGTPTAVDEIGAVTQLDVDTRRSCALAAGQVFCWGYNNRTSQLLANGSQEATVPTPTVVSGLTNVARFDTGPTHACAVTANNELFCFGSAGGGRLGNGDNHSLHTAGIVIPDVNALEAPASVRATFPAAPGELSARTEFHVGSHSVCGIRGEGQVFCFGSGSDGRLGTGSTRSNPSDSGSPVAGIEDAVQVATGLTRACALRRNGTVACWGTLTTSVSTSLPIPIEGITDAKRLAVGGSAATMSGCVVHQDGGVSCWGYRPGTRDAATLEPARVEGLADVTDLRIGTNSVCALHASGSVSCWGSGSYGQLGNGATDSSPTPVEVAGISNGTALGGGGYNGCVLRRGGTVSCWGSNEDGQLANGQSGREANSASPVAIRGLRGVASLSKFGDSMCAAMSDGSAQCWGANDFGQTGHDDSDTDDVLQPWEYLRENDPVVAGFGNIVQMGCGWTFCCALHADGHVSCAGSTPIGGSGGFLGMSNRRSSTPIAAPGPAFAVAAPPAAE